MRDGNSRILFLIDLIVIFVSFFAVFYYHHGGTAIPFKGAVLMGLVILVWFVISENSDIQRINHFSKPVSVLKNMLIAYSVLSVFMIAVVGIFGEFRPNDKLILYPLLYSAISSALLRLSYMIVIKVMVKKGYQRRWVLILGSGSRAKQVIDKITKTPDLGFKIAGILSNTDVDLTLKKFYLGQLKQFPTILRHYDIDEVIIATPLGEKTNIKQIVQRCEAKAVRFCIIPDFYDIIPKWTPLTIFGEFPAIAVRNEPLTLMSNQLIKRAFDITVSFVGLVLLSPIFLFISLGVKLSSPGPVLFRQKRIGNNNLAFTLYKFRSMVEQPPQDSDTAWTVADDGRITPFGKILRQTNIDELPQLWNVLVGDMSIVGPRPEREYFVEKFSQEIPNYRLRHRVKSGITGLAQAKGWRGDTSIQKRIENDLYYLEHWSIWLDLKIIFLTFFNRAAWKNAI